MRRRAPAFARLCAGAEGGQALMELALALPVMLALVGVIVDGGWALHQAGLVTAAAEAAQRAVALQDTGAGHCAGEPPAGYLDASRSAAAAAAPTLDRSRLSVSLRYLEPACSGRMRTLVVDLTYTLRALTPWLAGFLNGRHVTAESGSAVEESPPPWWGAAGRLQADEAQVAAQQSQIATQQSQIVTQQSQIVAQQSQVASQQAQLAAQQGEIGSQQAQLAAQQGEIGSQQAQLAAQQSEIASLSSLAAEAQQAQSTLAAQQAQIASLTSAYQNAWSAYQSALSAYQSEVSQVSSISQSAAYYYAQWQSAQQQLATREAHDGGDGQ